MTGYNNNYFEKLKPLSQEKKEEVPFGERRCVLCQLPLEELKELHNYKFEKGWTFRQITDYVRDRYNYTTSMNKIVDHFNKHCGKAKYSEITNNLAISFSPTTLANTNKDLSPATIELQKQTRLYMETITKMSNIIHTKINLEQLDQYVSEMNPLVVAKDWARFLKEGRELLSAINTLRSPKIIIDDLLDKTFKSMAEETARVLDSNCNAIMVNIQSLFKKTNMEFDHSYFKEFFRQILIDYTTKMTIIYKDFKINVAKTLDELENII